jgi:hypothetical protein
MKISYFTTTPLPKITYVDRVFVVEFRRPRPKLAQKAHDRHFCSFTTDTEQRFPNDFAAIEPDFFTLSLVSTNQRCSYPICVEQMIRTEEERAASKAKKEAKKS